MQWLSLALQGGMASLASYLAAHVLLCLVPAFFIAGALSALLPQATLLRYLGPDAPGWKSYGAAAAAGSLLAVCSCTVQPLFAGIYRKGAGLGPALTFLFFAPAANILALSYTGVTLGAEFALARLVLALAFGIGIGALMAQLFWRDDAQRMADARAFAGQEQLSRPAAWLMLNLLALLLAGTLKLAWLAQPVVGLKLGWDGALPLQHELQRWVPVNLATGAEGLTVQGLLLIALLVAIGAAAWRGLGQIDRGLNRLTWLSLGLIALTLLLAAVQVQINAHGVLVQITGRTLAVAALLLPLPVLWRRIPGWDMQQWLWESWRFVRQIFPLLVVGVFAVGVIRVFIQPEWIQLVAGANTVPANLAAVAFGVFMYFPTLVEVPVANMFLSLGMHPGPLLAYLMADPELSLQSILITTAIIGARRTWTWVTLVALFSALAGLTFGAWKDGSLYWLPLLALALALPLALALFSRFRRQQAMAVQTAADAPSASTSPRS